MTRPASVRWWWAGAWGAVAVLMGLVSFDWPYASDTNTTVYASGTLPVELRILLLTVTSAAALGLGTYLCLRRMQYSAPQALKASGAWAVVAAGLVLFNVFAVRESSLLTLFVTFVVAGACGGFVTNVILRSARKAGSTAAMMTARWACAFAIAPVVAVYTAYFIGAGTIDLFEALSLDARVGSALGLLLAGSLTGYVAGAIGFIPRPAAVGTPEAAGE